ncbi:MAG: hypothetical protein JKY22_02385 [Flavobacteriaceae bacterium]|nr:hypothetical protein [Flavobacteriaceae bacterium]
MIQAIYRKKAKQQQKPFILISRSYKQVNELAYHGSVHGIGAFAISLFKTLIYDISHRHPIIVLGDKDLDPDESAGRALYMSAWPDKTEDVGMMTFNEQTGITTIGHEVTWEEIFVNLAKASKSVLVIPATSEGFLTELNLLKSKGLGCKVVVYMWPEHNKHPYKPLCAHPEKWEEIRHTLREHGFNFPAHKKSGALIRLNEDFEVAHIYEPIPRKNILDLLNDVNFGEEHPMSSMVPFIENYEITANADRYGPMWGYTSS